MSCEITGRVSPSLTLTGSVVSGTQVFGSVSPSLTLTGGVETVCMKGKPFIVVTPDVMWLTPDNGFTDDFDVWANVDWKIE
jgi:hypothetical protein